MKLLSYILLIFGISCLSYTSANLYVINRFQISVQECKYQRLRKTEYNYPHNVAYIEFLSTNYAGGYCLSNMIMNTTGLRVSYESFSYDVRVNSFSYGSYDPRGDLSAHSCNLQA